MTRYLLLDTNILLQAADGGVYDQLKEDYPERTLSTTKEALEELKKLEEQEKGVRKRRVLLARRLAKKQDLYMHPQSTQHVDDALLAIAQEHDAILVTQDKDLQRRALSQHRLVLSLTKHNRVKTVR